MSCLAFRMGVAAIVGYSLGTLVGGTTVAWVLAAAAAAAMYAWSRVASSRAGRACSTGCATPRRRRAWVAAWKRLRPGGIVGRGG